MSTSKTWPGGATNTTPTAFSIPAAGELNWASLSDFLNALGDSAQATSFQKFAVRKATSSPVTVSATADCVVATDLSVAGAVTVNLPAGANKQVFVIIDGKGDAATNNVTINRNGSDTIAGATSIVLNVNREAIGLIYNSSDTDWKIFFRSKVSGNLSTTDNAVARFDGTNGALQNSTSTINDSGDMTVAGLFRVYKAGQLNSMELDADAAQQTSFLFSKAAAVKWILRQIASDADLRIYDNVLGADVVKFNQGGKTELSVRTDGTAGLGNTYSGTWTPTVTPGTNVTSASANAGQYMRVGNTVTASVRIDLDTAAAATATDFTLTLPVTSGNFTAARECSGTYVLKTGSTAQPTVGNVQANAGATTATIAMDTVAVNTSGEAAGWAHFTYRII